MNAQETHIEIDKKELKRKRDKNTQRVREYDSRRAISAYGRSLTIYVYVYMYIQNNRVTHYYYVYMSNFKVIIYIF